MFCDAPFYPSSWYNTPPALGPDIFISFKLFSCCPRSSILESEYIRHPALPREPLQGESQTDTKKEGKAKLCQTELNLVRDFFFPPSAASLLAKGIQARPSKHAPSSFPFSLFSCYE